MQIQSINTITSSKNNYPQNINGVNYKSKNNLQPSFKGGTIETIAMEIWGFIIENRTWALPTLTGSGIVVTLRMFRLTGHRCNISVKPANNNSISEL